MLFAVFQKTTINVAYFFETLEFRHNNFIGCEHHCNLFIYKRKNFIGCLEIRFQSYLLNLQDLHMQLEYLHIIKGIEVRFHSYLLNRHDLHMQLEYFPTQLLPPYSTVMKKVTTVRMSAFIFEKRFFQNA